MANILLTGGAGYIGSHLAVMASKMGHQTVIFDNFSNSTLATVNSIGQLTGVQPELVEGDILDTDLLQKTISDTDVSDVIHLAGLKSVEESVNKPELYEKVNVEGSKSLLSAMEACQVYRLIFSSSATVYGEPQYLPLDEEHRINSVNPYAASKISVEEMLKVKCAESPDWKMLSLRYFNPVGSHESGLLGDNARALKANLMPMIARAVLGKMDFLEVYGNDYQTPDGTCLRDYIHILDLAEGHLKAMDYLKSLNGFDAINLGTGKGISVLEMVSTFEAIADKKIPIKFTGRRPGDVESCYANCKKAERLLGWKAKRSLNDMCESTWHWCKNLNE
jgi:UDP-glucose 4-epimerase